MGALIFDQLKRKIESEKFSSYPESFTIRIDASDEPDDMEQCPYTLTGIAVINSAVPLIEDAPLLAGAISTNASRSN